MTALLAMIGVKSAGKAIKVALLAIAALVLVVFYLWLSSLISDNKSLRSKLATEQFKTAQQTRTIASLRNQHSDIVERFETLSQRNSVDFEKWLAVSDQIETDSKVERQLDDEVARINRLHDDLDRMLLDSSRIDRSH
ncbi:MAG: hypothetical protein JJ979_19300 [Roseibium sp.]|nr:hypothetical protein [Roseibium sp.]